MADTMQDDGNKLASMTLPELLALRMQVDGRLTALQAKDYPWATEFGLLALDSLIERPSITLKRLGAYKKYTAVVINGAEKKLRHAYLDMLRSRGAHQLDWQTFKAHLWDLPQLKIAAVLALCHYEQAHRDTNAPRAFDLLDTYLGYIETRVWQVSETEKNNWLQSYCGFIAGRYCQEEAKSE